MNIRATKQDIARIASDIVDGTVDVLAGCQAIVRLRGELAVPDATDPDLLVLVAIESELDDVPSGDVRNYWDSAALARTDAEEATYLRKSLPEILRACRGLSARWRSA